MLDPWIIEEILKKEDELRREQERTPAELPVERQATSIVDQVLEGFAMKHARRRPKRREGRRLG